MQSQFNFTPALFVPRQWGNAKPEFGRHHERHNEKSVRNQPARNHPKHEPGHKPAAAPAKLEGYASTRPPHTPSASAAGRRHPIRKDQR